MGVSPKAAGLFVPLVLSLVPIRFTEVHPPSEPRLGQGSDDESFLGAEDRAAWTKLLTARLLDPDDLARTGFESRHPLGRRLRESPLDVPVVLGEWARSLERLTPDAMIRALWDRPGTSWLVSTGRSLDEIFTQHGTDEARFARSEGLVLESLEEPLRLLLDALLDARQAMSFVVDGAGFEEVLSVRALLERHVGLIEDGPADPGQLAKRLEGFDSVPFVLALERLTRGAREAADALKQAVPPDVIEDGFSQVLRFDFGDVMLGGFGDDVHDWPAVAILEPGGNDLYRMPVASADGAAGRSAAIALDGGGDDHYAGRSPQSQGSASLGAAVLWDVDGNDRYEGGHLSQGASLLGASLTADLGVGEDIWLGGRFCQGAAVHGLSILLGDLGDDHYFASDHSQASAISGTAVLIERGGDDRYGVRVPAGGSSLAWSQAAATAEGLGRFESLSVLIELEGDDVYQTSGGAQAIADSTGIALLWDRAGDDEYSMRQLGQARARGHAVAVLMDSRGRDRYLGGDQSQAVAMSESIALLIDRQGADLYLGGDMSQAAATGSSVAALIDSEGADRYLVPSALRAQPWGDPGSGGLSFLIDSAGGLDFWSGALSEQPFFWNDAGATAWDVERAEAVR